MIGLMRKIETAKLWKSVTALTSKCPFPIMRQKRIAWSITYSRITRNYSVFGSVWILHIMRSREMARPGRYDISTAARIPSGTDLFYTVSQDGNLLLSRNRQAPGVQCILFSEEVGYL